MWHLLQPEGQDEEYFGGLREAVLERDAQVPGVRQVRPWQAHHGGASSCAGPILLQLMITLCPGCHAKVHRTRAVLAILPPLLVELWREQHPGGHEQVAFNFRSASATAIPMQLF